MMVLSTYSRLTSRWPWGVAVATGGLMGLSGDTGAQAIEAWKKKASVKETWSSQRSGIIFLWSWTTQGAPMYEWFRFLDGRWPTPQGVKGWAFWRPVFTKQVVHQAVTCPILNIGFLSFLSVWQREHPSQSWTEATERRLRQDLLPLMGTSLGYWGLVHNMNFAFIHPRFRILYMCSAQVVWTLGISLFGFRKT